MSSTFQNSFATKIDFSISELSNSNMSKIECGLLSPQVPKLTESINPGSRLDSSGKAIVSASANVNAGQVQAFNERDQFPSESYCTYMSSLEFMHGLAWPCEHGDARRVRIVARFITGVSNPEVSKHMKAHFSDSEVDKCVLEADNFLKCLMTSTKSQGTSPSSTHVLENQMKKLIERVDKLEREKTILCSAVRILDGQIKSLTQSQNAHSSAVQSQLASIVEDLSAPKTDVNEASTSCIHCKCSPQPGKPQIARSHPNIPKFSGQEPFSVWYNRYLAIGQYQEWTDREMYGEMLPLFVGQAGMFVYGELSMETRSNYTALIEALQAKFDCASPKSEAKSTPAKPITQKAESVNGDKKLPNTQSNSAPQPDSDTSRESNPKVTADPQDSDSPKPEIASSANLSSTFQKKQKRRRAKQGRAQGHNQSQVHVPYMTPPNTPFTPPKNGMPMPDCPSPPPNFGPPFSGFPYPPMFTPPGMPNVYPGFVTPPPGFHPPFWFPSGHGPSGKQGQRWKKGKLKGKTPPK